MLWVHLIGRGVGGCKQTGDGRVMPPAWGVHGGPCVLTEQSVCMCVCVCDDITDGGVQHAIHVSLPPSKRHPILAKSFFCLQCSPCP